MKAFHKNRAVMPNVDFKALFKLHGCKVKSVLHQNSPDGFGWVYKCYHCLGVSFVGGGMLSLETLQD